MNQFLGRSGRWLVVAGGLALAGFLAGCGTANSGTVAVTGKVTKGGQPVPDAAVTFVPVAADGKPAAGTTDASGVYKLTTFVNGDGALPGSYKIKITKFAGGEMTPSDSGQTATAEDADAIYKKMQEQGKYGPGRGKGAEEAKNEIPEKFATPDSSGLTAEVKAGSANSFDFDVTEM